MVIIFILTILSLSDWVIVPKNNLIPSHTIKTNESIKKSIQNPTTKKLPLPTQHTVTLILTWYEYKYVHINNPIQHPFKY